MKILFDRSLGFHLPKHFSKITSIDCYTRKDVVKEMDINPTWKVSDAKFIQYAEKHDCLLVTSDIGMAKRATAKNIFTIWMHPNLGFWNKIFRILQHLNHPLFDYARFVDLRFLWRDTKKWKMPNLSKGQQKEISTTDYTYLLR